MTVSVSTPFSFHLPSFSFESFKIFHTQSVVSPHFNSSSDRIAPLNSCDQRLRTKSDVNRDQEDRERDFIPPIRHIEGTHHASKLRRSDFLFSVVRARGENVRKHWHTHYVGCGQLLCGLVSVRMNTRWHFLEGCRNVFPYRLENYCYHFSFSNI